MTESSAGSIVTLMPTRTPQFIDTDTFELSPRLKGAKYLAQNFTGFTTGGVTEVELLVAGAAHCLVASQDSRIRSRETPGFIFAGII